MLMKKWFSFFLFLCVRGDSANFRHEQGVRRDLSVCQIVIILSPCPISVLNYRYWDGEMNNRVTSTLADFVGFVRVLKCSKRCC